MSKVLFQKYRDELLITESRVGVRWHGRPLGLSVEKVESLPDGERAIILLDYGAGSGPSRNLVSVNADGELLWQAPLPHPSNTDAYTSFDINEGRLNANTWSGYNIEIDINDGSILRTVFVK